MASVRNYYFTLKFELVGCFAIQRIGTNGFDIRVQHEILYPLLLSGIDSEFEITHYFSN